MEGPDADVETAWRFFLANWLVIGAMGAALGRSLVVARFSLDLSGLVIAVGYVGLYGCLPTAMRARQRGEIHKSCSCSAERLRSS